MADLSDLNYNLRSLGMNYTLNVTVHVTREFVFRYWLAHKLFRLAARILGCKIVIDWSGHD